jgi:uncharacterized protein (TIGR03437 family)
LERKLLGAPLSFEPNHGQADPAVEFLARGSGFALSFAPGEIALRLERQEPAPVASGGQTAGRSSGDTLRMSLIGADRRANGVGSARQPGVVSYFVGNDPKKWRSGIPTYGKVTYSQIYPGVDLVFYGNQRQLEYDFVVSPGADASRIAWRIDGSRARLDAEGNLVLQSGHGQATFRKPVLYQMDGTKRVAVDGVFAVRRSEVRFRLGSYDHSRTLTIDPVLSYASYLAGTGNDYIGRPTCCGIGYVATSQGLAVDSAGSVYVTGRTGSVDFPMANALPGLGSFPARLPGTGPTYTPSTFVTKFSPDGSSLVYSTYLGGASEDDGYAIAVDSAGEAYVTGSTTSANFPITTGAYQTLCSQTAASQTFAACPMSAFVTKLNAKGTGLVYSTFLGGVNTFATGIAVDSAGRAYVAGNANEPCQEVNSPICFPTTAGAVIGGSQTWSGSPQYAFVAALDPTGAKLLYSTLFGDLNGIYAGNTANGDTASTYAAGAAVDSNGYFYLFGETEASKLPTTPGVVQPTSGPLDPTGGRLANSRGYIAKFNPMSAAGGSSLAWATYLGGHSATVGDFVSGLAVDSAGNVYVGGATNSSDFPVTTGAYSTACGYPGSECQGGHLTKLNSSGQMVWSTYIGGAKQDGSDVMSYTGPVQLDGKGNVYFIGTTSFGFPWINPAEPWAKGAGGVDVVVVELDPTGSQLLFSSVVGSGGLDGSGPGGMAVDSAGNIYVGAWINGPDLITTPGAFQTKDPTPVCCTVHGYVAKITPSVGPLITEVGTTPDVFNAATLQTGGIAPNEFITLKGAGLGPATGVTGLTTELGGSSVSIGGTAAYLTYAQDGQINLLVPFNVSGLANTTIQVEYNGVKGNTVTVPIVASSPGIFTQQYGPGQAWVVNQDQTFNSASNAAPRGTYVEFWVTGQGLVNTTLADGTQPSGPPYPTPMLPVSVTLGGFTIPAANIAFDGLIYSGEVQINVLIPANAPTGSAVPLVVTIGGASSRSDATIAIK